MEKEHLGSGIMIMSVLFRIERYQFYSKNNILCSYIKYDGNKLLTNILYNFLFFLLLFID